MHVSIVLVALVGCASAGYLGRLNNRPLRLSQGYGLQEGFDGFLLGFERGMNMMGMMDWNTFMHMALRSGNGMRSEWMKLLQDSGSMGLWSNFLHDSGLMEEDLLRELDYGLTTPPSWFGMWMNFMSEHQNNLLAQRFGRRSDMPHGMLDMMNWESFMKLAMRSRGGMHSAWMKWLGGFGSNTVALWNGFLHLNGLREEVLLGELNLDRMDQPAWFGMWLNYMAEHQHELLRYRFF